MIDDEYLDPWEGADLEERAVIRRRPTAFLYPRPSDFNVSYVFTENYRKHETALMNVYAARVYVEKVMKVLSVLKKGKYVPPRDCYFDVE